MGLPFPGTRGNFRVSTMMIDWPLEMTNRGRKGVMLIKGTDNERARGDVGG